MHFNVSMNKTINHAQDKNIKGLSNSDNFESFVNRSDMLLVLFSGKNGATVSSEVSKSRISVKQGHILQLHTGERPYTLLLKPAVN